MPGVYIFRDGLFRREGRPVVAIPGYDDGFTLGVTMPQHEAIGDPITNVGCLDGPRLPYTGPAIIDGSPDPDHPTLIESRNIDKLLTIRSGYVSFFSCAFSGSGALSDSALVDCRAAGIGRVWFERCDFDPGESGASPWLNALIGHHMTVERCYAQRVVDFVGSYNTHGPITANVILGNLMGWHAYFYADVEGVVHPSDVRTHNDGIQHQGGGPDPANGYPFGIDIRGNRLRGRVFLPDGVTTPPDQPGVPYAHQASQAFMCQQNVQAGTAITPRFSQNWLEGYWHTISMRTRTPSDENPFIGTPYDAVIENNIWLDDDRRYYGTSADYYGVPGGRPYTVRCSSTVTINGVSFPTDQVERPVGAENRYANLPSVVAPARRGQLVTVRRDPFPGG